ncbi:MAG: hypothetical protein ACO1QB_12395 [Verrucomicrobiales bacterium]
MKLSLRTWMLLGAMLLGGCVTKSTIESRRIEKGAVYASMTPAEKMLVDQGQIKIGMSADAVYIAWGPPSEVLESEDPQSGRITTWRYYGSWMEETRYWAYRETSLGGTDLYLERYLLSDYNPRDYVRAELLMQDGRVLSWRTLPRPQ